MNLSKEQLMQHRLKRMELLNEKQRLSMVYEDIASPKAVNMDGMPHGTGISDITFNNVVKIDEETKEIKKYINQLEGEITKEYVAYDKIIRQKLDNPAHRQVIRMRYFSCLEWNEIFEILHSGKKDYLVNREKYIDDVYRKHRFALKKLSRSS